MHTIGQQEHRERTRLRCVLPPTSFRKFIISPNAIFAVDEPGNLRRNGGTAQLRPRRRQALRPLSSLISKKERATQLIPVEAHLTTFGQGEETDLRRECARQQAAAWKVEGCCISAVATASTVDSAWVRPADDRPVGAAGEPQAETELERSGCRQLWATPPSPRVPAASTAASGMRNKGAAGAAAAVRSAT